MRKRSVVCDTPVLLYLGRIGHLDLLPALFAPIYIPEQVVLELDMGRLLRRDTVDPRNHAWATLVAVPQASIDDLPPNRLGVGECAVIAHASTDDSIIAGLDDLQARRLAETLGIRVVGTLPTLPLRTYHP